MQNIITHVDLHVASVLRQLFQYNYALKPGVHTGRGEYLGYFPQSYFLTPKNFYNQNNGNT